MAPKTADKKAVPKSSKVGRKPGKKGKKSVESWKIYIYKVAFALSPLDPLSCLRLAVFSGVFTRCQGSSLCLAFRSS